jgi:hypothetical protein
MIGVPCCIASTCPSIRHHLLGANERAKFELGHAEEGFVEFTPLVAGSIVAIDNQHVLQN